MFENPRRGRQARNFTTNVPKIPDLKSSSEQILFRKSSLGAPEWWDRTKTGLTFTFRAPLRKIYESTHIDLTVLSTLLTLFFNWCQLRVLTVLSFSNHAIIRLMSGCKKLFTENCWLQCCVTRFSLIECDFYQIWLFKRLYFQLHR